MKNKDSFFSFRNRGQIFWYNLANVFSYLLILFSIVFVFPIDIQFFGEIRYIESIGHFLFPILSFGLAQAFVNFTPLLESYHIKTFFGNSIIMVMLTGLFSFLVLVAINYEFPLPDFFLLCMGILIGIGLAYIEIFKSKALFLKKVTLPVYLEKLVPKLVLIILFYILYSSKVDNYFYLLLSYAFVFIVISVVMLLYILKFTRPRFSVSELYFFENFSKSQLIKYSSYSLVASIGSYLAFRIDGFLIPQFLTMQHNGVFSMAALLASAVAIPSTGITALNLNSISALIYHSDTAKLGDLYIKSAKDAFFYCSFVFILVWISLPLVTSFHSVLYSQMEQFETIVAILGIGILVNISTGFNTEIITYSKYIRYNIFFILLLSVVNIAATIWFLKFTQWALIGVAISMSLSLILYNLSKLIFIKLKFNIWPFDMRYFIMILCFICISTILFFIPYIYSNVFIFFIKLALALIFYYLIKLYLIDGRKVRKEIEYY